MEVLIFLYIIAYALPCGAFASRIADYRGYSAFAWFFGGLLFGIIPVIAAIGLPIRRAAQADVQGRAELKPRYK